MEEQVNGVPDMNGTEVNIGNVGNVNGFNTSAKMPDAAVAGVTDTGAFGSTPKSTDTTANASWKPAPLPVKAGFWGKVKSFLFQEIKVDLTPKQQKVENELNAFLFKEISFFGTKKTK